MPHESIQELDGARRSRRPRCSTRPNWPRRSSSVYRARSSSPSSSTGCRPASSLLALRDGVRADPPGTTDRPFAPSAVTGPCSLNPQGAASRKPTRREVAAEESDRIDAPTVPGAPGDRAHRCGAERPARSPHYLAELNSYRAADASVTPRLLRGEGSSMIASCVTVPHHDAISIPPPTCETIEPLIRQARQITRPHAGRPC